MLKQIFTAIFFLLSVQSFAQISTSQFADPTGNYSTSSSGVCLGCSINNTARVADMDVTNFATITISAGLVASRGIRAKLNALTPGNTYAGFYVNIGSVVSALPSVFISTYKNGLLRQNLISNGNIATLMGGAIGYVSALTNSLDYDEVGISLNGGLATVGMTAQIYYAIGGYPSPPQFALPVMFTSFEVKEKYNLPHLTWTSNDDGSSTYEIERSYDGIHFNSIAHLISNINAGDKTFSYTDKTAENDLVFYRVHAKPESGVGVTYSRTVAITLLNYKNSLRIFPNPLTTGTFSIHTGTFSTEAVILKITDNAGKIIYSERLTGNNKIVHIRLRKSVPAGLYFITMQSESSLLKSLPVLIQ